MSQSGIFFPTLPEDAATRPRLPWFKRRGFLIGAGLFVLIGAAVITDLPQHPSLAAQVASDTTAINQMNNDAAACAFAVGEALTIHQDQVRGTLSSQNRAKVPTLLEQDQVACSFTSRPINDLATIELPGSSAGRSMNDIVSSMTLWTSSDADAVIIDVTQLFDHPGNAKSTSDLKYRERLLATDKQSAISAAERAGSTLRTRLPKIKLPSFSTSG